MNKKEKIAALRQLTIEHVADDMRENPEVYAPMIVEHWDPHTMCDTLGFFDLFEDALADRVDALGFDPRTLLNGEVREFRPIS